MAAKVAQLRLMFLGAPGVGKGTYAQRLTHQLAMPYISSGDLLRSEVASGSSVGAGIKRLIDAGEFVPDAMVESLVKQQLARYNADSGYVLDGYPRNLTQAKNFDVPIDWVVNLRQPHSVIVAKLSSRRVCPKCGMNYNYANINEAGIVMEPLVPLREGVCDKCGHTDGFVARADDDAATVRKRLQTYDEVTKPLEAYYEARGMLTSFDVLGGAKQYLPMLIDHLATLERRGDDSALVGNRQRA